MIIKFNGKNLTLEGKQVKEGEKAPNFEAVNTDLSLFDSKSYNDKIKIYSVVPSIDTGICSLQAQKFNEKAKEYSDDAIIITVSNDLPFAQKRFCENKGIENSIIISDYMNHEFGMKYGFLIKELKLLTRGIIIVDKNDIIKYVEYVPEITNEVNFDKAYEKIEEILK